jgi:hypothetical protein
VTYQATGIVSIVWAWVTDSGMTRVSGSSPSAFRSTRNHDQNPDYKFRPVNILLVLLNSLSRIRIPSDRRTEGACTVLETRLFTKLRHMVAQT